MMKIKRWIFVSMLLLLVTSSFAANVKVRNMPAPVGGVAVTVDKFFIADISAGLSTSDTLNNILFAYFTGIGITTTELGYLAGSTELIQVALDARCLEAIFGDAIGTGLFKDGTTLKVSATLQKYHAVDPSSNMLTFLGAANYAGMRTQLNVDDGSDVTGSNPPQAHAASHQNSGGDEVSVTGLSGLLADDQHVLDSEVLATAATIKLDDFATPDDTTDLDATITYHGLLPKLSNDATEFFNGVGAYAVPATLTHAASHQNGGSDEPDLVGLSGLLADDQHVLDSEVVSAASAIKLDDFATPDDNTDLDATITEHGLVPKLPDDATKFFNGVGAYTVPPGHTDLTEFVSQTPWRIFYSNGSGATIELALGALGTYVKSTGVSSPPVFDTPPGSGDVTAASNIINNSIVRGDGGAKGVQDSGVLIDDDDNVSGAASYATVKSSGVAGQLAAYEANSTDTNKTGFEGAANIADDMFYVFPDADPTLGQFWTFGTTAAGKSQMDFAVFDESTIENSSGTIRVKDGGITKAKLSVDAKFYSIAVAELGDSSTPSVLTTSETTNVCISNYKASGADHVFTMPAPHAAGNIIFAIGDEFQVDIEPNPGDLFYLNKIAMDVNEHIQNTDDTLGERIVGYCVNINGTLRWMFYSSDVTWVEETP